MARALRAGLRNGGLRRGGLRPGLGNGSLFAIAPLDLHFARSRTLDPRVTFTRASSGTYVGSDGLIKTATTNLLLRSEEFDNASWAKSAVSITSNTTSAPTGQITADKAVPSTELNFHSTSQTLTVASGTVHTFSIYAKADGYNFLLINTFTGSSSGNAGPIINLSNGQKAGFFNADYATVVESVGNGWYRISFQYTTNATSSQISLNILPTSSVTTYTGNGTSGIFLWGAQLEQSSTVGEYIPTTSTINSAPRFDHNPTTGESLGLLVEEQRTNLLLRSEEFDNASWLKFDGTVTANAAVAPDGTTTADKFFETATTAEHILMQSATVASSPYTWSVFIKAAERTFASVQVTDQSTGSIRIDVNLTTGANNFTTSGSWTSGSGSVTNAGNGWYRVVLTGTRSGTGAGALQIRTQQTYQGALSFAGNSSSGILVWGAQLEAGAFPTSYIPTTTATVTRSADVASITGTNFSSWYNQIEGTTYWEARASNVSIASVPCTISDGTGNNRIHCFFLSSNCTSRIRASGTVYDPAPVGIASANVFGKAALAVKANDGATTFNSATPTTNSSVVMPIVDRMAIGTDFSVASYVNGTIRRLTFWPQRLNNSTLQTLTQP